MSVSTDSSFKAQFPSESILESHLKKHTETEYLAKHEDLLESVSKAFNKQLVSFPEARNYIGIVLFHNESFQETLKSQNSYKQQEELIKITTSNIFNAIRECAKEIRSPLTNRDSFVCRL